MPRKEDQDLFRESTMTFGEHLEELRVCLFRALVGLGIGFVIGLFLGDWVVDRIQDPLRDALTVYYQDQSSKEVDERLDEFRKLGYPLPEDPDELEEFIEKFILDEHLVFERVRINPNELLRQLREADPEAFRGVSPPADKTDGLGLASIYIWRSIEDDSRVKTKSLNAPEAFVIFVKAALLVGALLASPWIFYQIWTFVASGLYRHERKFIHIFLPFSLGLFLTGAAMAFVFVFPPVLKFLFYFNRELGIDPDPRISEWLGFVLILPFGFGISFQLPLVMLFLERIGIFSVEVYLTKWRVAILIICIIAMMLSPPDPTSMLLMAIPLTFLYFGGVLLCKLMPRSRSPFDDDLEEEKKEKKKKEDEEEEEASTPQPSKGKRFWFVLKMVIVAMLVVLLFAWRPWNEAREQAHRQKAVVDRIEQLDGKVFYDYQLDESGERIEGAQPSEWRVLRPLLGADFFDTVVEVDLSGTEATDAALEPLEGLTGLKKLDLRGTKVTKKGVEELRAALPDCKITADANEATPKN